MREMTTWRKELENACIQTGDNFDDLIISINDGELDKEFDSSYGGVEGAPFTAWSKRYVYFPACYKGSEWVDYVDRNICLNKTYHIGGG